MNWFRTNPSDLPCRTVRTMDAMMTVVQVVAIFGWIGILFQSKSLATALLASIISLLHVIGIFYIVRIANLPLPINPVLRALRRYGGWLMLPITWQEFAWRWPVLPNGTWDNLVSSWDRLIGGGINIHMVMPNMVASVGLQDTLKLVYFLYYPLLVIVVLASIGAPQKIRDRSFLRIGLTYWTCFCIYFLFPVAGPRAIGVTSIPAQTDTVSKLSETIRHFGDALGTAFPSSHTAGTIVLALVSWSVLPKPIALVASACAALMPFAVMSTQNHWALDAIAAIIVVLFVNLVLVHWLVGPPLKDGQKDS